MWSAEIIIRGINHTLSSQDTIITENEQQKLGFEPTLCENRSSRLIIDFSFIRITVTSYKLHVTSYK